MIFDLHNDFPTVLPVDKYAGYLDGSNATVTAAVWTTELPDALCAVQKAKSVFSDARKNVFVAIEDMGFAYRSGQYERMDFSAFLYCSLTWNHDNAFAGGAHGNGRLTSAGKKLIRRMEECGCYTDVAHLNKESFWDVLDVANKIICSHTGFTENARCLDDARTKALCNRNAVIGLCTVSAFSGAHDARQFADAIDRFVSKYGDDCLAFGTDFYGSSDIPNDLNDYAKLASVEEILLRRGYTQRSVEKIFYGNARSITNGER